MDNKKPQISPDATVNQVISQYPATLPIFNQFGIDSCCGGGLPVSVAAERHGLDAKGLLASLAEAAAS